MYSVLLYNPRAVKLRAEELLGSKNEVKKILATLQEEISEIMNIAHFLDEDCEIYKRLKKTMDNLMDKEDYSQEEGKIMAFKNRSYMLQSVLHDHIGILKKHLESMSV